MRYVQHNIETQPYLYNNWYVLYVTVGKEYFIKNIIEKYTKSSIKTTIFQREILQKRKGKKVKVIGALFSGYIFIHEKIDTAISITKKYLISERIFPIAVNKKPCTVKTEEMKLLLDNSDENGLFKISKGKKVKNTVYITDGALRNFQGNIVWIDENKNKAQVEISLFKRKLKINLGLDIIMHESQSPGNNQCEYVQRIKKETAH